MKPEKKKMGWGLKLALTVLVVLLVLMLVVFSLMNYVLGRIGRYDDPGRDPGSTQPVTESFETNETLPDESVNRVEPEDVVWEDVDTVTDEDVINILLIGQDAREGEGRARSDSMILLSLNKKTKDIRMTSFMRDMYVQIPGYQDNRINAAFAYGGPELLNQVLELNFGVRVDGNVEVNFQGFEKAVDILGGVDVELSQEEARHMSLREGINHLSGEQALSFCRIRDLPGGDYMRTDRQRRVIAAIIESMRTSDLTTVAALIDQLLPCVTTNLSDWEIIQYAGLGLSALGEGKEILSARIPAEDAHYSAYIRGLAVLVPDLEMCQEDLEEFLYEEARED